MNSQTNPHVVFAGMATLDLVQFADALPAAGMKGTSNAGYFDIGGPVTNAAIAARQLGARVALVTGLGAGPLPGYAKGLLAKYEMDIVDLARESELPVASIWVDGAGERTVLSADNRGATLEVSGQEFVTADTIAVLLDGHYPELQLVVATQAVAADVPVVLDCGRWRPVFADLLPLATDVIASAGFCPPEMAGIATSELAASLCDRYGLALAAITRGEHSILVAAAGAEYELEVPQVQSVDTMGAGDVFHGAYVFYRYVARLAIRPALEQAAVLATASCRHHGVRQIADPE